VGGWNWRHRASVEIDLPDLEAICKSADAVREIWRRRTRS
jgi:hypothetical protein